MIYSKGSAARMRRGSPKCGCDARPGLPRHRTVGEDRRRAEGIAASPALATGCRDYPRLERHHGRTPAGVVARVMQRILTLTTAIWHNDQSGQPVLRSLTAYDH
ncbi:hypothetical protein Msi02_08140 [Microbispora siamensis]|uniref:Transposase n=1 Tax=Microbispora siamensis TaxID=564413 RepID=A0ABQ4GEY8_9ACTN|nr:hypothetical protein Msi02_08140 [Microbispora siamensis]